MELYWFLILPVVLLWGMLIVPRLPMAIGGLVVLITGTVFGPYFYAIDGPFAISIDRVLWLLLLIGFAAPRFAGRVRPPLSFQRLDWLLVALTGYLLISTQIGEPPADGSIPLARWIFYVCMPLGIYLVTRFSRLTPRHLHYVHAGMVLFGIYLALTALAETSGFHAAVFPRFIADPAIAEFFGRARGPLLNPSGNGFLMTITTCAIVIQFHRSGRLGKCLCAALAAVSLAGVYATMTRSVWLSVLLAVAVLEIKRVSRPVRIWGLAAAAVVLAIIATGFGDDILYLKRDKHLSGQASVESIQLRPLLAVLAFEIFQDRPILGVGYGHYFAYNSQYAQASTHELPLRKAIPYMQHNVILSLLTDAGLIGAMLLTVLLICWGLQAWRIANHTASCLEYRIAGMLFLAALVGYLTNGMFQDVSVIPMVNMYLFYFAGLAGAVENEVTSLPAASRARSHRHARLETMAHQA